MARIFDVQRIANKITLGTTGTTINIASHTASKILALDGSKDLEVVTIGTSLDYTRPTLNTVQDIRTTASPQFASIELGHADDTTITRVGAGVIAVEGTTVMLVGDAPTSHTHDDRYYTETEIGDNYQPLDDELTSLAGLSYTAASFVKMTGAGTFVLRTIANVRTDLSISNVEDTAISTWAGSGNITTVGALASGSIAVGFTEIPTARTAAKCTDATADNTAGNETSHADVVVDGDFGSNGIMNRAGAGSYSILALGTDVQAYHANLAAIAGGTWTGANSITTLGTIASGTWQGTTIAINQGGTSQTTAQAAINVLSDVSGGTDEHVLTKDTGTGNAIWKAAAGVGTDEKVKIDSGATAGYIGAANNDGILRTGTSLSYADGGDYITINTVQDLQSTAIPTFTGIVLDGNEELNGSLYIQEQPTVGGTGATYGQIWVKDDEPNILMFTDDIGTDFIVNVTAV